MTTTANNQPEGTNQTIADMTLTCERCGESWIRRNMNKLPKTCPRCRSRYWQSPLTPYWAAYRRNASPQELEAAKQLEAQQRAAIKQAEDQELAAAQQRIHQLLADQINQTENLILYTCTYQAALKPIKHICNIWLPENMNPIPSLTQLCQLGNTIASTSPILTRTIRELISKDQLPQDKVFWINIEGSQQYVYTFTKDGITQTCYGTTWPAPKED